MRILQVFGNFQNGGGVQTHIFGLTNYLRENGHEVWIAGTMGKRLPSKYNDDYFLNIPLINVNGESIFSLTGFRATISCIIKLRKLLKAKNIQLIHVHEVAPAFVSRIAAFILGIPIVFTNHGAEKTRLAQMVKHSRLFSDRFIAICQYYRDLMIQQGIPEERIELIYCGVDSEVFKYDITKGQKLRSSLLGEKGKWLMVTVGRLHRQRGIDVLIRAAKIVKQKSDAVKFVIVGDGEERESIQRLISENQLEETVQLTGWKENPYPYLLAGDIFVFPSRWDGLPLAIVEAFRSGLPVIATPVNGVPELVEKDRGRLVEVENPRAIARNILDLIEQKNCLQEMAERAKEFGWAENFDTNRNYNKISSFYCKLAKE